MPRTTLTVTGMTCDHCVKTVEEALKGVPGVDAVGVFLDEGEAEVDHDEAVPEEGLVEAVRQAGYQASLKV